MPGPTYNMASMKAIPYSDMPGYNPTSPKWNPTQSILPAMQIRSGKSYGSVPFSGLQTHPGKEYSSQFSVVPKAVKQVTEKKAQSISKYSEIDNPSHIRITGSKTNTIASLPPAVHKYWADLLKAKKSKPKAEEPEIRGIKRKGSEGMSKEETNPSKKQYGAVHAKTQEDQSAPDRFTSLALRPLNKLETEAKNQSRAISQDLVIRTR